MLRLSFVNTANHPVGELLDRYLYQDGSSSISNFFLGIKAEKEYLNISVSSRVRFIHVFILITLLILSIVSFLLLGINTLPLVVSELTGVFFMQIFKLRKEELIKFEFFLSSLKT